MGLFLIFLNISCTQQTSYQIAENTIIANDLEKHVIALESDECIVFTAHWDHFGIGPIMDGDSIYNDAFDDNGFWSI